MKLLCVSHYFAGHGGGIERVAGKLAEQLVANRLSVSWAATCSPTDSETGEVTTIPLRAWNGTERIGLPFPVPGPGGLAGLHAAVKQADVVLIHDGMYLTSVAAMLLAKLVRRPTILVQHVGAVPMSSPVLSVIMRIVDRCVTRPMLRLADRVVFISATSARHFKNMRLAHAPEIVFNGVDTALFCPDGAIGLTRACLGLPADRPVALFVGRLVEKKGVLRLREMARLRPDLHWAFAGWGPIDPESWGLDNVSTHRGLAGAGLADLYRAADLLVLPSTSEGFPLVVQEALACGLRVVCCDDAAFADEAAAPYLDAVRIDPADEPATLARIHAAMTTALATPDSSALRQDRAIFAAQRYSWRASGRRYTALADDLIAAARGRGATRSQASWSDS